MIEMKGVGAMVAITDQEFKQLAGYIKSNFGIYLKDEKQALLTGRLWNVLQQNNFNNFSDYYQFVVSDKTGAAAVSLIDRITTNYTYFMRETEHFNFFRERVLPVLLSTVKDRDLRIWSAGCSTGEEPYTLAILMDEFFSNQGFWDKKILATDISTGALHTAVEGTYDEKQVAPLPPLWLMRYFQKLPQSRYAVKEEIKNEVLFRKFNLISDRFSFKKPFHAIFCRNVMIYFDQKDKRELIDRFYEITAPGGYLFVGHSEAIAKGESRYSYVMPAVYQKI